MNVNKNTSYYYVSPTEICFDIDVIKTDYYAYYTLPDGTTATPWYFFSNVPSLENTIDWNNDVRVKRSVYMGSGYICKMDGGPYKYVYLYFKDEHGNTDEKCFRLYENYYNTNVNCTQTKCSKKTGNSSGTLTDVTAYNTVKVSIPKVEGAQLWARIKKLNPTDNKWENFSTYAWEPPANIYDNDYERRDFQSVHYVSNADTYDFVLRKEQTSFGGSLQDFPTWIKLYTWSYKDTAQGCDTGYYNTTYICMPYYTNTNSSVSMKDLFYGARGITPWTDDHYLMHTFVSDTNYGKNIHDWLNCAEEVKIKTGCGFAEPYTEPTDIPAGKYYTTIIHFADGDMEMTEVKQK